LGKEPYGSTSLDPNCKVEIKINEYPYSPPFHFIFMRVKLLGKSYGINLRCYWERLGELEGNPMWNHIGNEEKIKTPFPLPPRSPLPPKKTTGALISAC
jgi:hypothetical protein